MYCVVFVELKSYLILLWNTLTPSLPLMISRCSHAFCAKVCCILMPFPSILGLLRSGRDEVTSHRVLETIVSCNACTVVKHNGLLYKHFNIAVSAAKVCMLSCRFEQRLLHPGANTADIISQYISAIRSLKVLDPSGVVVEKVCQPIKDYLRCITPKTGFKDCASLQLYSPLVSTR